MEGRLIPLLGLVLVLVLGIVEGKQNHHQQQKQEVKEFFNKLTHAGAAPIDHLFAPEATLSLQHPQRLNSFNPVQIFSAYGAENLDFSGEDWSIQLDPKGKMAWFERPQEKLEKTSKLVATGGVMVKRGKGEWQILNLNITAPYNTQDFTVQNQDQPIDLAVMSFNIRYGTANDGENSWYNRDHLVFQVIRDYNPVVLGVQEALLFQLQEITANVPGYRWIGVGRDDGQTQGEYAAILFKTAALGLLGQGTFWLCDQPNVPGCTSYGNSIPRICTWGHFLHYFSGRTFYAYNCHFDHLSAESRRLSAEQLIRDIRSRPGMNNSFVITGDFNNGAETSPEITIIKDAGFDDSFRVLYPNASNVGTFNGFTGADTGTKIDFVFTPRERGLGGPAMIKNAIIIHDNDPVTQRYPSDHFPVSAIFDLP